MKPNWKKYWAEIVIVAGYALSFLAPSLQAYVMQHSGTALSSVIALALTMGFKKSPLGK